MMPFHALRVEILYGILYRILKSPSIHHKKKQSVSSSSLLLYSSNCNIENKKSVHAHMKLNNSTNIHTWREQDNRAQQVGQSLNVPQPNGKTNNTLYKNIITICVKHTISYINTPIVQTPNTCPHFHTTLFSFFF